MDADHYSLPLREAAKRCPNRPSIQAVWRWARKGIKARNGQRITLDHRRIGSTLYTSAEALARFFAALTDADRQHFTRAQAVPVGAVQRRPDTDSTNEQLRALGFRI